MFPKITCPCGFEVTNVPDAAELYRKHTCPEPTRWPHAVAAAVLVAGFVAIVWAVVWWAAQ